MKCLFGLLMLLVVAPIDAGVLHYDEAINGHFSLQNPTSLKLKKGLNIIKGTLPPHLFESWMQPMMII